MKKHLLIFAAFCAAVLVSCTPSEILPDTPADNPGEQAVTEMVTLTITARFDGTKAYIDDADGYTWKWADGDQLAVYDASNNKEVLGLTGGADTDVATFTGPVPSGFVPVKGIFPASAAGASADEYTIPAVQTIPAGKSIDPATLVATATSDNGADFNFTSAVSFLRVNAGNDVARVIIHTNDDATATMTGASASVTCDPTNVSAGSGYWIAVKPAVYHGIRVFTRTASQITAGTGRFVSGTADLDLSTPGQGRKLGALGATDKGAEVCVIENGAELVAFLDDDTAKDAYVVNDLDLSSQTVTTRASFANLFDGQHHTISHWTSNGGVSMFATVTGTVKNFTIDASCAFESVPMSGNFGPVTKLLSGGTVSGVTNRAPITANGTLTDQRSLAGIVGRMEVNSSRVEDCHNYGAINTDFVMGSVKKTQYVAGVVGVFIAPSTNVRVKDCTNHGNITVNGLEEGTGKVLRNVYIGGIVGCTGLNAGSSSKKSGYTKNYGTILSCHNSGKISANWNGATGGYFNLGGIIGVGECALDSCTNEGEVSLTSRMTVANARPSVGGIAGGLGGTAAITAKDCINRGAVSLTGDFSNGGTDSEFATGSFGTKVPNCGGCFGVVGDNTTLVQNCDNYGAITINTTIDATAGSGHTFGGIVGYTLARLVDCDNLAPTMNIADASKTSHIGGIVGQTTKPVENCNLGATITLSFDATTLTTNQASSTLNFGGIVGYLGAGGSISECSAQTGSSITVYDLAATTRLGALVGMCYGPASDCTNYADLSVTRKNINGVKYVNFISGVIGYIYADANTATVSNCQNHGEITVKLDKDSDASAIGGVVGAFRYSNKMTGCSNDKSISIDGCNMPSIMYVGGVLARSMETDSDLTDCSNSGSIDVSNFTYTGAYSYIGGVQGVYSSSGNDLTRCSNSGNITVNAPAKVRVGAINGALFGSFTDCFNTGDITVNGAADGTEVAGFAAYGSASITGGYFSGNITATNTQGDFFSGLVFGRANRENTIKDFTLGGSISGSGITAGILFGGFEDDGTEMAAYYTLGAAGKPLTILSSANINGTPVALSNPPVDADLIGDVVTHRQEVTDPTLTYTNVVIN